MFSTASLRDLYAHMEWADATVWRTAAEQQQAHTDQVLIDRFFHTHLTQRLFLQLWTETPLTRSRDLRFASLAELFAWCRPYYDDVSRFIMDLEEPRLDGPMPVPWARMFRDRLGREPAIPTLGETIYQVAAHSTFHRGQVNTRLRELGSDPPLVDYIAWLWLERPSPEWPYIL